MTLEEEAQVQQRTGQQPPVLEQQRHKQATDTPVSVEVRMDRLELNVNQACSDHGRKSVVRMHVAFKICEHAGQEIRWWWHVDRVAGPTATDPVLGATHRSWLLGRATDTAEQKPMGFIDQPDRQREPSGISKLAPSEGQRIQVIANLFYVSRWRRDVIVGFVAQKVHQRGLCPFDLRRKDRLLAHEGVDEPIKGWHHLARELKTHQCLLGSARSLGKPLKAKPRVRRRQRVWYKRLFCIVRNPHQSGVRKISCSTS